MPPGDDPAFRMTISDAGTGLLSFHAGDTAEMIRTSTSPGSAETTAPLQPHERQRGIRASCAAGMTHKRATPSSHALPCQSAFRHGAGPGNQPSAAAATPVPSRWQNAGPMLLADDTGKDAGQGTDAVNVVPRNRQQRPALRGLAGNGG